MTAPVWPHLLSHRARWPLHIQVERLPVVCDTDHFLPVSQHISTWQGRHRKCPSYCGNAYQLNVKSGFLECLSCHSLDLSERTDISFCLWFAFVVRSGCSLEINVYCITFSDIYVRKNVCLYMGLYHSSSTVLIFHHKIKSVYLWFHYEICAIWHFLDKHQFPHTCTCSLFIQFYGNICFK